MTEDGYKVSLGELREILKGYFDDDELHDLCFDLGVDYEVLPGQAKGAKARELVAHCYRHGLIPKLIRTGSQYRPHAPWPSVSGSSGPEQFSFTHTKAFPHKEWPIVNQTNWLHDIVKWFDANYKKTPLETMTQLLNHVFAVIRNARPAIAPLNKVIDLGKALQNHIPMSSIYELAEGRDRRILILLERGLHTHHSHMFMLPQVYKSNLLKIEEYSALLLSTKLQAAGEHAAASALARKIAGGKCPLAEYVIALGYRTQGVFPPAHTHLNMSIKELGIWEHHKCPFNWNFEIICSEHLLAAEVLRAKGVVFRLEKNHERAENFYVQAEAAADRAIEAMQSGPRLFPKSKRDPEDMIWDDYDRYSPYRVKADVCFSHGYYWYARKQHKRAERLFKEAVSALENADEQWDSPYTRLAVVQLCQGDVYAAAETFTKAYVICKNTPIEKNREAPLSLALCTLGLRVIELCDPDMGRLTLRDPLDDLEEALSKQPQLTQGPLDCHRNDAKHFLIGTLKPARKLIKRFIERIERVVDEIQTVAVS
jgi:tetratricopeptide (TPR) repeat protein